MELYDTRTMLAGMKSMKPTRTFLRDTFFPASDKDVFATKKVVVDYEEEASEKMAPAVIRGAIPVQRGTFTTEEYTAPLIAPSRILTTDQLEDRQFNEAVYTSRTPAQREAQYLAEDTVDLEKMIARTEEYMAAQLLVNNEYTIKQYIDQYDTVGEDFHISFFGNGNNTNQARYTPSVLWNATGADILADLKAIAQALARKGRRASTAILGADVADVVSKDEQILKLLDNRRYQLSDQINPEQLPNGTTFIARLNCGGYVLDLYEYDAQYTDNAGQERYFYPADSVTVTAPGIGRRLYGAVTLIKEGTKVHETYAASRVPQVLTNERDGIRELILRSRPLLMPKLINPYITAKVL